MNANPERISRLATGLPQRLSTAYLIAAFLFFQTIAVVQIFRSLSTEDQDWLWLWVILAMVWPAFWIGLVGSTNMRLKRKAVRTMGVHTGRIAIFTYSAAEANGQSEATLTPGIAGAGWVFTSPGSLELWSAAGPQRVLQVDAAAVESVRREVVSGGFGQPRLRIQMANGTAISLNVALTGFAGWLGPSNRSIDQLGREMQETLGEL